MQATLRVTRAVLTMASMETAARHGTTKHAARVVQRSLIDHLAAASCRSVSTGPYNRCGYM